VVGRAPSGSGVQLSLHGLLGVLASHREGPEVNVSGLTFGVNPFSPSLELTMVGRLGVPPPQRRQGSRRSRGPLTAAIVGRTRS
jgi:hypothetical protein